MNERFLVRIFLVMLSFTLLCFKPAHKKITIFSIGDSTMAWYDTEESSKKNGGQNYPLRGWMMAVPQFFNKEVEIHNAAISGISSKSFRDQGAWKKVIDEVKPGDYVFIQFGHNDEKPDTTVHTEAGTSFHQNLINYITESRAKGAYPVLFTSIVRRKFNVNGKLEDTHGDYVTVVRQLAKETNVPLIDLNKKTSDLVESLGPEESKKLYLYIEPGAFTKLPEGKKDDTHLCEYGAYKFAELAVQGLKQLNLGLVEYLK